MVDDACCCFDEYGCLLELCTTIALMRCKDKYGGKWFNECATIIHFLYRMVQQLTHWSPSFDECIGKCTVQNILEKIQSANISSFFVMVMVYLAPFPRPNGNFVVVDDDDDYDDDNRPLAHHFCHCHGISGTIPTSEREFCCC
jgi:hypothetical protein